MPQMVRDRKMPLCRLVESRREELVIASAFFLRVVHGRIRSAHQTFGIGAIVRVEADADAGIDMQFMVIHDERRSQRIQHLLRDQCGIVAAGQQRQAQHEFIAAETGYTIAFTQTLLQAICHQLQHAITDLVSERIVDVLEMIQIDEEHRHLRLTAVRLRHSLLDPVLQKQAVRQSGKRIVMRHVDNPFLRFLALGDIFDDKDGPLATVGPVNGLGQNTAPEHGSIAPFHQDFYIEPFAAGENRGRHMTHIGKSLG